MVTETSSEMQNHSCTECSKTTKISRRLKLHVSSNHNKKDLHAFDYEVILLKSKLRELKHLRKKNQTTKLPRDLSSSTLKTTHTQLTEQEILLSEANLQHTYHVNMAGDYFRIILPYTTNTIKNFTTYSSVLFFTTHTPFSIV